MRVPESTFVDTANVVFHEDYAWDWHAVKVRFIETIGHTSAAPYVILCFCVEHCI